MEIEKQNEGAADFIKQLSSRTLERFQKMPVSSTEPITREESNTEKSKRVPIGEMLCRDISVVYMIAGQKFDFEHLKGTIYLVTGTGMDRKHYPLFRVCARLGTFMDEADVVDLLMTTDFRLKKGEEEKTILRVNALWRGL